jgi:hypothetical protein
MPAFVIGGSALVGAAGILTRTSRGLFVRCMRQVLPPEDSYTLTDAQLHPLHEAMCERLHAKAGSRTGAWEVSRPAGQA